MCGIFGLHINHQSNLPPSALGPIIKRLLVVAERRGKKLLV